LLLSSRAKFLPFALLLPTYFRLFNKGGALRPDDKKCSKTGQDVIDIVNSKDLNIRVPSRNVDGSIDGFEQYDEVPMCVPHASDHFNIGVVGAKVQGGVGGGG
jgi:hypothetical protein